MPWVRLRRAFNGVRDPRTGRPFVYRDLWRTSEGVPAYVTIRETDATVEILSAPVELEPGRWIEYVAEPVTLDHATWRTMRTVVARPAPRFGCRPGDELAFAFEPPSFTFPAHVWPCYAAKVALGVACELASIEEWPRAWVTDAGAEALRDVLWHGRAWSSIARSGGLSAVPESPSPLDSLVGGLATHEHRIVVWPRLEFEPPLLQLVLFGELLYELHLPALPVREGAVWTFDARRRTYQREPLPTFRERRLHSAPDAQLRLAA